MSDLLDIAKWDKPKIPEKQPTQVDICKKCNGSFWDKDFPYCNRFDLALYVDRENKLMKLGKNDLPIECDGQRWDN